MRILDVGCGIHKQPGSIGIDRNPASRADVLADLDRFPYPFADSSFDRLTAIHVIEHVDDVIRTMEEFHRLVRKGGTVRHRDAALHRFQLVLRPHAQEPPEQLQLPLLRRESRRLRLLLEGAIPRGFGAGEAAGVLAMAGFRIPGESLPAVPAVLGALPLLRRARQGDGVRVRSVEVARTPRKRSSRESVQRLANVIDGATRRMQAKANQNTDVNPKCPATAPAIAELAATKRS